MLFLGIISAVLSVRWYSDTVKSPGPLAAEKLVYIAPGTHTKSIAAKLREEGVISNDAGLPHRCQAAKPDRGPESR